MKMLEDLEEVVRLAEKATPGPWLYRPKSNSWHKLPPDGTNYSYGEFIVGMDSDFDDESNGYDEAFLIAAVQFMSTHHATIRDMAARLEAAERDAARWRHAMVILPVEYIRDSQREYLSFGLPGSEEESLAIDQAIDQAIQEAGR